MQSSFNKGMSMFYAKNTVGWIISFQGYPEYQVKN